MLQRLIPLITDLIERDSIFDFPQLPLPKAEKLTLFSFHLFSLTRSRLRTDNGFERSRELVQKRRKAGEFK